MSLASARGEDWRWADLSGLPSAAAARPSEPPAPGIDWQRLVVAEGPVWVFLDGRLLVSPPGSACHKRVGQPLTDGLAASGARIELEPAQAAAGLLQLIHFVTGGPVHVAHRYVLAADAQASILETYASVGDAAAWSNVAVEIVLGAGARLMRGVRRTEGMGVTATETTTAEVGAGGSYSSTTLLAGTGASRAGQTVTLTGAGAFASIDGVALARGGSRPDVFSRLVHRAVETTSRQTWRAVAADTAIASLVGRIEVERGAQKTDAAQSIRGLVFDRTAAVYAKPELEIFADDVKAAHGCAVGALDKDALFYLQARGVEPSQARVLLTEAFVASGLDRAGDELVRAALHSDASRWLEAQA